MLTEITTLRGVVSVYAECRTALYSAEREYSGLDPQVLLPEDFSAEVWESLTAEERALSISAKCFTLRSRIAQLERRNGELVILAIALAGSLIAIVGARLFY